MVLLAPLRGQESEITVRSLSGIAAGMIGVAILIPFGASRWDQISAIAILVSELAWAIGVIHARGVKTKTPALTFAAMQMICGGGLLWTVGLALGEGAHLTAAAFPPKAILSLAYLVTFGSIVAFTAYTWLLKHRSPAVVSTHSYVNPLVAVFLGWAFGGESVNSRTLSGAAIILAAVALLSKKPPKRYNSVTPVEAAGSARSRQLRPPTP
jgi:drug/metabolite transporter (DMT)-like permease